MKHGKNIPIILQIFKRDVIRLLRNPIALIIVIGICFMPSLYAWYTIEANWDPYQRTDAIKVAVADEDSGADNELIGHLNVGEQVVEKLKENHELGWEFVSEQQAMDGVQSGEYYAAIVIPKDFSADFLSVFSGDFKRPIIDYYVNEKISASAPEITNIGASTLENEINMTFVSTVSETVVELGQKTGRQVESSSDAADAKLSQSISQAQGAIAETQQQLGNLDPTFDEAQNAISHAQTALRDLNDELPSLEGRLADARSNLGQMRSDLGTYGTQVASSVASAALSLGKVSTSIAQGTAKTTAALIQAEGQVDKALSDAQSLNANNQRILEQLESLAGSKQTIKDLLDKLEADNQSTEETIEQLQKLSTALGDAATSVDSAVSTTNQAVQSGVDEITKDSAVVQGAIIPEFSASLDALSSALGSLEGIGTALEPIITSSLSTLDELSSTIDQAKATSSLISSSLGDVQATLQSALTDLTALRNSEAVKNLATYLGINPDDVGDFMASPITLHSEVLYPIATYGSGVAPFFTNLGLWVAGFILLAVFKVQVDPEGLPKFTLTQAYFARWLLIILLGLLQGLIVCVGDLVLGVECHNPVAFVGAGLFAVFVYVNLIFALTYAFRHIGRAIAVVFLIVQIPGSSGTYPVEMMPPFYQLINPLLPFTYSIDAMREAIGGMYGLQYWFDLAILGLYLPIGFFIGLVVGRYSFNLNLLFDHKLGETGFLLNENIASAHERFRLRSLIEAMLNSDEYRQKLNQRVRRFRDDYPLLIHGGWIILFFVIILTLILRLVFNVDVDTRVVLLVLMSWGIILACAFLVVVEFLNEDLNYQVQMSHMSEDELLDKAQARIDKGLKS